MAFVRTDIRKAPERTPRQESSDGCVSGMLSFHLQKSPTPNLEEKCGNSPDISKGISQSEICKFESSKVSQTTVFEYPTRSHLTVLRASDCRSYSVASAF